MVEGLIFIFKGLIITGVLTNAARTWSIFDAPRTTLKRNSFIRNLLDCFECTSVWAAFFTFFYLTSFEWAPFTYALIFHRLACILHEGYCLLEAVRSKKEGEL